MFFLNRTTAKSKDFIEDLCDKYKPLMMKLALQITNNTEDAEDAVQDALFALYKNKDKIKDINSDKARNYIYTVTKNAALKKIHEQNKHSSEAFHEYENKLQADEQLKNDAFCDVYGFSEDMLTALNQLNSDDKDLICYYYGAGYAYSEISNIMNVSEGTLRKRMSRIKQTLANILREENGNK